MIKQLILLFLLLGIAMSPSIYAASEQKTVLQSAVSKAKTLGVCALGFTALSHVIFRKGWYRKIVDGSVYTALAMVVYEAKAE